MLVCLYMPGLTYYLRVYCFPAFRTETVLLHTVFAATLTLPYTPLLPFPAYLLVCTCSRNTLYLPRSTLRRTRSLRVYVTLPFVYSRPFWRGWLPIRRPHPTTTLPAFRAALHRLQLRLTLPV